MRQVYQGVNVSKGEEKRLGVGFTFLSTGGYKTVQVRKDFN